MYISIRGLYGLGWITILTPVVLVALIWATRDAIKDLAFRWRMRGYKARGWRPGRCLKCGYDTRANGDRCSECGEPVATLRPPPRQLRK